MQRRFAKAGVERRLKYRDVDRQTLEEFYSVRQLPLGEIAGHFKTSFRVIGEALAFHCIPKREPLKSGGKRADFLRSLEIGEKAEITLTGKSPQARLHRSASAVGIKIRVRSLGSSRFEVTRIE